MSWTTVAAALLSYFIGALPFSAWVASGRGVNIRKVGSGNPGATNVARALGVGWGILSFLLDAGKGVAAVALTGALDAPLALSGLAVVGHNWSPFLRLSGGKGVATTLGLLLPISWPAALCTMGLWASLMALTRKVSLSSILALLASPAILWLWGGTGALVGLFAALGALSLWRHRQNIQRLWRGQELPFGNSRR